MARVETFPVGLLFDPGNQPGKITAVERSAGKSFIWHLILFDQIATTKLERINIECGGHLVDEAFDNIVGFWPPGTAISISRRGVRYHLAVTSVHGFDLIDPGADEFPIDRVGQN